MIKSKSSKSSPSKDDARTSLDWWDLIGEICTALVVVGVGGELIAHRAYSRKNKELEQIVDQERQAKDIDRANFETKARSDIETAHKEAEGFRLQIAQANERAAEARARAAKSELDLAKLRLPRSLTEEQKRRFISDLKPFSGTPILIVSDLWDAEALRLATQLSSVLEEAGWKVTTGGPVLAKPMPPQIIDTPGVWVEGFGNSELPSGALMRYTYAEAANVLSICLGKAGLLRSDPGGTEYVGDNQNQNVIMIVGRKM